jgi:hypothetical protein
MRACVASPASPSMAARPSAVTALVALALFACLTPGAAEVESPAPPTPPARIAILHMYDGVSFFRRLGGLTGANKQRYAERHGYDLVLRSPDEVRGLYREGACAPGQAPPCWEDNPDFTIDSERKPTFGKLKLALAACNNRPQAWLLWSDADALIVNQTVPLESLIDDGYDIMVAYDWLMLQAGVLLFKCSPFTVDFLHRVYDDRAFDTARALDQSALQAYIDKLAPAEREAHVKFIPKCAFNVYLEEYRAGDFLVHMAGKLYEATEPGLWAIANQLDILSIVDDVEDIDAFLSSRYLLNRFSGVCPVAPGEKQAACKPSDPRRMRLKETLGSMSTPHRYRHVALRYYFLQDWTDKFDVPNWNEKRKALPLPRLASSTPPVVRGGTPPHQVPPVFSDARPTVGGPVTAPHIQLVKDRSPPRRGARGSDFGPALSGPGSSPWPTRLFYAVLIVGLAVGARLALQKRQLRHALKQH